MNEPARYLSPADRAALTPVHAVWEITLACDLKCQHCGSRAGRRRPDELSTDECLDLVRQKARLGTREVTLIGGEAYLRRDWLALIREIRAQGMNCTIEAGAEDWQVQLTVAMGRAADRPELLLQPFQLFGLMPLLAELHEEGLEHG